MVKVEFRISNKKMIQKTLTKRHCFLSVFFEL